jgi:hypothetical protein
MIMNDKELEKEGERERERNNLVRKRMKNEFFDDSTSLLQFMF